MKGDEARPEVVELADPLIRPVGGPSNKARTSLRASSNIDSNDICFARVAITVEALRFGFSIISSLQGVQAAMMSRQVAAYDRIRQEQLGLFQVPALSVDELSGCPDKFEILHRG